MTGFTFDTGALIALERRRQRIGGIWSYALVHKLRITVPAVVVTEWWRRRSDHTEDILDGVDVEPVNEPLARLAGEALAAVSGAGAVDAIVMASASRRGDVVFTSDVPDLTKLQRFFPAVRVLAV